MKCFEEFELGSGESVSIRDFVEEAHSASKSKSRLNFGAYPYRDNEIMVSKADISKLKLLGWTPKNSIKEGVSRMLGLNDGLM